MSHEVLMTELKREIAVASALSGEGHVASAYSILDILWVLYDEVLRVDPQYPDAENRDRFILSKGHASLGLYAVLAEKGFLPRSDLYSFGSLASRLGGHPDSTLVRGVEASTGSLGHGLPFGVGVALALRLKGSEARVFVLVGDGECNEGSIWESVLLAAHHQLQNLVCVVDYNHSTDRALRLGSLAEKFSAFGWSAVTVDGHDHEALSGVLTAAQSDRPQAVIANTVKGHGCPPMEGSPAWHHRAPSPSELPALLECME